MEGGGCGPSGRLGPFGRLGAGGLGTHQLHPGVVQVSLQARAREGVWGPGGVQDGQPLGCGAEDAAGGGRGRLGAACLVLGGLELAGQPGERRGGGVKGTRPGAHRLAGLLDVSAEGEAGRPDPAPVPGGRLGRGGEVGGDAVHGGGGRGQPPGRGAQRQGVTGRDGDRVFRCGDRHRSYLPAGMMLASTAV
jgi:hypothetical protein